MFTLAISCLTASNLHSFMDLTFQVPMQYCSLQHQTLLSPPDTSTTGHCFHFGAAFSDSFWSYFSTHLLVAYWEPTNLGSSPFSVILFCLFMLFMRFSRQECWSGLPFPSPVDHVLSEIPTITCPSWVSYIAWLTELDKAVIHVISLFSFLWLWFSVCLSRMKIRCLWKLPDGRGWLWGKLGLALVGGAMTVNL